MNSQIAISNSQPTGLSRGLTIFTFLIGIFMGALDHGIVGPALSSIFAAFQVDASWGVWSFTVYTLIFAISIPILGKLSDRIGRKETFTIGIIAFAIGSLIAAFAPHFPVFLLGRAIQAIGTGGIFPITAAQIAFSYPPEQRGKALGWIGVAFGIGSILGPTVGGFIISNFDWQWIFLINVPISVVILLLISRFKQDQQLMKKPIDFIGIGLLTVTILSLMLGITLQQWSFIFLSIIFFPLLVWVERKQADPVMNIRYFTKSNTLTILLASLISGFVMATTTNLLPLYSETLLGLAKGNSGLSVTPLAISSMAASLAGGYLVDKMGAKKVLLLGFMISVMGALSLVSLVDAIPAFLVTTIIMGFGMGIIIGAPLNILILQAVEPKETGAAVGYLSLFRSLGSTLGPTVAGQLLATFTTGFNILFLLSATGSMISIIILKIFIQKKQ